MKEFKFYGTYTPAAFFFHLFDELCDVNDEVGVRMVDQQVEVDPLPPRQQERVLKPKIIWFIVQFSNKILACCKRARH